MILSIFRRSRRVNALFCTQKRNLNVQEHVSYTLLNEANIATPRFGVAKTTEEAAKIAGNIGGTDLVVKAQVLAGGRGVGTFKNGFRGGVRLINYPEEVPKFAGKMLNQILVTKQTGAEGKICKKVMVAERMYAKREFYFSIMLDPSNNGPIVIASASGGVNIEDVVAADPKAVKYYPLDICQGLTQDLACKIAGDVGIRDNQQQVIDILMNMYQIYITKDSLLVEINPLAEDHCGNFFALDAKLNFDDSSEFRQLELFKNRDLSQEDPNESKARKFNISYVKMDGEIGCMVNGAGLAMATMDIIHFHGASPANFLDVGGGATPDAIKTAFEIITSDPNVSVLFVNIFGGIVQCDLIAQGLVSTTKDMKLEMPIVVRLQGTNAEKAKQIIDDSKTNIFVNNDFNKAAKMAARISHIMNEAKRIGLIIKFAILPKSNVSSSSKSKPKV